MGIASQAPKTWKKPPEGIVKLHSDASLFGFESALDVLARDDRFVVDTYVLDYESSVWGPCNG